MAAKLLVAFSLLGGAMCAPPGNAWTDFDNNNPIQCGMEKEGSVYKVKCQATPDKIPTLRYENHLWLPGGGNSTQNLHIEVPNYHIEELVKAAYKETPMIQTLIKLLLQKPTYHSAAEYNPVDFSVSKPSVQFGFVRPDSVEGLLHHGGKYTQDRPLRPLSGPLVGPADQPVGEKIPPSKGQAHQQQQQQQTAYPNPNIDVRFARAQRDAPLYPGFSPVYKGN